VDAPAHFGEGQATVDRIAPEELILPVAVIDMFLKEERPGVRAIGLDTASLDIGASADFPAHVSWLPSGRYGIENLANLDALPALGAIAIVGAPRLAGGSGGPSRVLALVS
jgi:kynurenine formamidase